MSDTTFLSQTSVLRALDPSTPTYIFPAMNTLMYNHPLTAIQIKTVIEVLGYTVEGPIGKNLACGDVGTDRDQSADQRSVADRVSSS